MRECMQLSTTSSAPGVQNKHSKNLSAATNYKRAEKLNLQFSVKCMYEINVASVCLNLVWHHTRAVNLLGVMKWLCYGLSNSIPTHCYVSVGSDEGTILSTLLRWVCAVCRGGGQGGCVPSVNSGARRSGVIARSSLGRKRPA